jgi:hypothetical protein
VISRPILFRSYMTARRNLQKILERPLLWFALLAWPTMSKAKRKRWRRYWGCRSPHLILQKIGETTI